MKKTLKTKKSEEKAQEKARLGKRLSEVPCSVLMAQMENNPQNDSAISPEEPSRTYSSGMSKKTALQLRGQIEFYLGDANLVKDKFLQSKLAKTKRRFLNLRLFLSFNKIKEILNRHSQSLGGSPLTESTQLKMLQDALHESDILTLSKNQTQVKRKVPFVSPNETSLAERDSRTIYVENLPETSSHELVARIFSPFGRILHISLPKLDNNDSKGFAFVEFGSKKEAEEALEKMDMVVPSEIMNDSSLVRKVSLKVMAKEKWQSYKEQFKEIKRQLKTLLEKRAGSEPQEEQKSHSTEKKLALEEEPGRLCRLTNVPKDTDKNIIRVTVRGVQRPEYVDWKKGTDTCVIRFDLRKTTEKFLEAVKTGKRKMMIDENELGVQEIEWEEEKKYLEMVSKKKERLKEKFNKKLPKDKNNKS